MPYVLCTNCGHKFDDKQSYRVMPIHLPAYLAKSNRDEDVTYQFPYCPQCGAERGFRSVEIAALMRPATGNTRAHPFL